MMINLDFTPFWVNNTDKQIHLDYLLYYYELDTFIFRYVLYSNFILFMNKKECVYQTYHHIINDIIVNNKTTTEEKTALFWYYTDRKKMALDILESNDNTKKSNESIATRYEEFRKGQGIFCTMPYYVSIFERAMQGKTVVNQEPAVVVVESKNKNEGEGCQSMDEEESDEESEEEEEKVRYLTWDEFKNFTQEYNEADYKEAYALYAKGSWMYYVAESFFNKKQREAKEKQWKIKVLQKSIARNEKEVQMNPQLYHMYQPMIENQKKNLAEFIGSDVPDTEESFAAL